MMAALCRNGKGRIYLSRPSTGKYGGDMKEGGMSAALGAVRQAWRMCCLRRTFGCCAAVNHWPACVHVGVVPPLSVCSCASMHRLQGHHLLFFWFVSHLSRGLLSPCFLLSTTQV